ncbi:MAG: hypothetical protein WA982_02060 [Rubrobacteraceae bacterium]
MNCGYCGGLQVEGMTLAELVNRDFNRARRRSILERLTRRLRGVLSGNRLVCFAEERGRKDLVERKDLGIQAVELAKVEGSVGRCGDFDPAFMPVCSCLGERWRRVDLAFRENKQLPPVRLYKLGVRYFVEDGNHRVSVARYKDLPMIEAEVTELLYDEAKAAADNESGGER